MVECVVETEDDVNGSVVEVVEEVNSVVDCVIEVTADVVCEVVDDVNGVDVCVDETVVKLELVEENGVVDEINVVSVDEVVG